MQEKMKKCRLRGEARDAFFGGTFGKVPPSPFKTFWEKF
jgi:hypothetical protein